jgi:ribosome maturation factor RimP
VAGSYGLDIFDVQLRRESIGMVLRVIIDRPDTGVPEDEIAETALDKNYTLEVSSPGLDRPLRHEADYRRFAGRLAKLVTLEPVNGQSAFSGRIAGIESGEVLLEEGRRTHRVPFSLIKRGQLVVEF